MEAVTPKTAIRITRKKREKGPGKSVKHTPGNIVDDTIRQVAKSKIAKKEVSPLRPILLMSATSSSISEKKTSNS